MKKILLLLIFVSWIFVSSFAFAGSWNVMPTMNWGWLPWSTLKTETSAWSWATFIKTLSWLSKKVINYVVVIAVLCLMWAWVFYIVSLWDNKKTEVAKKWIIRTLLWTLLTVSGWAIVNIINNISIQSRTDSTTPTTTPAPAPGTGTP